jgi:hypothetical protein
MDDVVFPWGISYTNGGPAKDLMKAYRNQSLLFRQIRPVYHSPEVFFVVPINSMLGGESDKRVKKLYQSVNSLMSRCSDFGVIDDQHLDRLPSSARQIVYPTDDGGLSFKYPNIKLDPSRVTHSSGVYVFTIHEVDGVETYVVVNDSSQVGWAELPGVAKFELSPNGTGLFRNGKSGRLLSVEGQGKMERDGKPFVEMKGHFALISYDGKDLSESKELVILPFGVGEIDIGFVKSDVVIQMGQVADGKWQPLSESKEKKIITNERDAYDIRIVAQKSRLGRLGRKVVSELTLRKGL